MKKYLYLTLFLFFQLGIAQNYQTEFKKFLQDNDTINQLKVLTKWEKAEPNNAELFTSYFNYYIKKSKKETKNNNDEESRDDAGGESSGAE